MTILKKCVLNKIVSKQDTGHLNSFLNRNKAYGNISNLKWYLVAISRIQKYSAGKLIMLSTIVPFAEKKNVE